MTTTLPLGDESTMSFEGVSVAFFEVSEIFRDSSAD
jgi:hypothetical protein